MADDILYLRIPRSAIRLHPTQDAYIIDRQVFQESTEKLSQTIANLFMDVTETTNKERISNGVRFTVRLKPDWRERLSMEPLATRSIDLGND